MKKIFIITLLITAIFALSACAAEPAAPAAPAAPAPESGGATAIDAKALVEKQCAACHSFSRVSGAKYDAAGWTTVVDRMIAKGPKITFNDAEKAAAIEYLAATYK